MGSEKMTDELAMVRTRLARLKARESELCAALIQADATERLGRWTRADVVERTVRIFDHRLLPFEVQGDPMFWREKVIPSVELSLRDGSPAGAARASAVDGPPIGAADAALMVHSLHS